MEERSCTEREKDKKERNIDKYRERNKKKERNRTNAIGKEMGVR